MKPIILFRSDFNADTQHEFEFAEKHFDITTSRVGINNKLVIGRYSVLPFYHELDHDLFAQGSYLTNNVSQHRFIADFYWYEHMKKVTPETWFRLSDAPDDAGPFVLKGRTNSRKFEWNRLMFAQDKRRATDIECELMQDSLIGPQGVIVRKYVRLKTLEIGLNGLPFSNEWRFFFYKGRMLAHGFYWTASEKRGLMNESGMRFAKEIGEFVAEHSFANFYVIDIAEKENGEWIMIEMNDGQMSGLSDCDPDLMYGNLAMAIKETEQ